MNSNKTLVEHLVEGGYIQSSRVEQAFRNIDRANFVPEEYRSEAYRDRPLPIGKDATISAPHMVAMNTELLEVESDHRVAEVGSGSGYQAAILGELCREVIGVDISEDLVEKSRDRLKGKENVEIVRGDGLEGLENKFDRILFSCAIDSFEPFENYLKDSGIIVAPINQDGSQVLKKYQDGEVTEHGRVRFVNMR